MAKSTINWTDPSKAAVRAAEIGFPFAVLTPTIDVWTAGMNSATEYHAENYAGTIAWHEAVKTVRMEGRDFELEKLSRDGVQLCYCAKTKVALMIAQGDARTGDRENLHLKPSTKYPRGPISCAVLEAQLTLFAQNAPVETAEYEVWILMLYLTPDGVTRAELSWPSVIAKKVSAGGDESGTIVDWRERIFIDTSGPGPTGARRAIPSDLAPTGAVDVPLKKRA